MISIILPTYNRFEIVQETVIKALSIQTAVPFEIIVVNDGSALPFSVEDPKVTILTNLKKGASCARNYGADHAKYEILFFIDDDMWITGDSINAIETLSKETFFDHKCVILNWEYPAALIKSMNHEKIGRYLLKAGFHTLEGRLNCYIEKDQLLMPVKAIGSGSFAIHKNVFMNIGKYDETILFQGEDTELSERLNTFNIPIFLFTPVTCFHNQRDRLDIGEFLDREQRGYLSQFQNKKVFNTPNQTKQLIYKLLMPFYGGFLCAFHVLPNSSFFDIITFRIIGILSSIVYFKAWFLRNKN